MVWFANRRDIIKAAAAATFAGLGPHAGLAQDVPEKPEAGGVKMGIEPWLGYGQWHVAAKKDLFKAQGLGNVEIVNFNTDADNYGGSGTGNLGVIHQDGKGHNATLDQKGKKAPEGWL